MLNTLRRSLSPARAKSKPRCIAEIEGFGYSAKTGREKIPLGRTGKPVEIAKLAAFLCSDEASFIIGQTVTADGGTTALMSLLSDFRSEATSSLGGGYVPGIPE